MSNPQHLDHAITSQPRLTREQEIEFSARARAGRVAGLSLDAPGLTTEQRAGLSATASAGREARDAMILSCYPLVIQLCSRIWCEPSDRADLISDATFGLMHAVDTYEAERGYRLSTYASHGIIFATRVWRRQRYSVVRMRQVESPEDLDDLAGDPAGEPACERLERLDATHGVTAAALRTLPERHREVLEVRVMADVPTTLAVLGKRYGVSKERVRQIEAQALRLLRRQLAGVER
jgi:RNA polymerase sigma factor (sigma-70 family)